jgi:hypothetical protein
MSIGEELARLADLHQKGQLSDAEFAKAKQAILSQAGARQSELVPDGQVPRKTLDFPRITIVLALVFALFSFLVFVAPNWREADEFERTLKKEQDEINRRSNNPLDAAPDGKGRQVPVK